MSSLLPRQHTHPDQVVGQMSSGHTKPIITVTHTVICFNFVAKIYCTLKEVPQYLVEYLSAKTLLLTLHLRFISVLRAGAHGTSS